MKLSKNQNSILIKRNKINILVALSSNDAWFLLPLLSEWQPEEDIQIWMTIHPVTDREQIIDIINKDLSHLQIDLNKLVTLLQACLLQDVICLLQVSVLTESERGTSKLSKTSKIIKIDLEYKKLE